jgi:serine/threonine-protein kinase
LLTGELPFDGESPFVIVMKHQSAPVPDLVDYGLPKTVSFMVRKMMAKDPAGRYQNISAVLSDLLRVMMDDSDLLGIYQANLERSKGGGGAIQYRPPTQLQRDQVERPENHQSEITAPEPPLAAMRDAIPAGTVSNKPSTDPMVEKPVHPDDRQLGAEPPSSIWNVHKLIETGRKGKE